MNTMRLILTNFLLLISILGVQAQTSDEKWFRPIKVDNAEFKDAVIDGDTIRFFKGEWLETVAKGSGDVILGIDTLHVDAQSIGDYKKRTKDNSYSPISLTLTAVLDTVEVTYNGVDTIACMIINQTRNVIISHDFRIPGKIVLPGLDSLEVLRFAPKSRASVVANVSSIDGYGVAVTIPDKPSEPGEPNINKILIYIGAAVLVLLIVGALVWFIFAHKRNVKTDANNESGDKQEAEVGHEEPDSKKELPGSESLVDKVKKYEAEIAEKDSSIDALKKEKMAIEERLNEAEKSLETAKTKISTIKDELKKEYEAKIGDLESDIRSLQIHHDEEIQSLNSSHAQQMTDLSQQIEGIKTALASTSVELQDTRVKLKDTEDALDNSKAEVVSLNQSLVKFNTILSEVPFAMEYAAMVGKLLNLAEEINLSALRMLDLDLEDPYNIMKYISRYAKVLSSLDMQTLNAEVKMLEKGNVVLVGSTLATYNRNNSEEDLKTSACQYFFTSYLQKLIDGLVVLNESMAGADRLVDGVTKDDVKVFVDYRIQLQELCLKLGVVVENVRLFDKVGEKIDLSAQLVDIGFSTGDIVDMENAVVYLEGARRPEVKVRVKVQE